MKTELLQHDPTERTGYEAGAAGRRPGEEIPPVPTPEAGEDEALAQAALRAIDWNVYIPAGDVQATVRGGFVHLKGSVDWEYQKTAAERAVRGLPGVRGVFNAITLERVALAAEVRQQVRLALARRARLDAPRVTVEAREGWIILSGQVRTLAELDDAARAAWTVPGVCRVDNNIVVRS